MQMHRYDSLKNCMAPFHLKADVHEVAKEITLPLFKKPKLPNLISAINSKYNRTSIKKKIKIGPMFDRM